VVPQSQTGGLCNPIGHVDLIEVVDAAATRITFTMDIQVAILARFLSLSRVLADSPSLSSFPLEDFT